MMKYGLILFLTIGFLYNAQAQEPGDKIIGIWLNEDKTNTIEIYKASDTYSGKIVGISKLTNTPNLHPKDKNNPNPELRNRDILGMDIITGLQYSGAKWIKGTIYTPKKGVYANCQIELLTNGQIKIIVSKSGFTKTQIWTRQ